MSFNYNLLKPLSFLLETQSINETATRLNTSASAVSRTLRTLREEFQDELLTRKNGKMALTAKGIELRKKVSQIVGEIESLDESDVFNPKALNRDVTIAMNASIAHWFAPIIIEHLTALAPNLRLTIEDWSDSTPTHISEHRVDYAIHYFPLDISKNVVQKRGEREYFVCACRQQHPLVGVDFRLEYFERYPLAVQILKYFNELQLPLLELMKSLNIQPHVALRTTHLGILIKALENNDFLFPCSIHLARVLGPKLTYLTSTMPELEPLQQRDFGFLYDKTKSNDPFIKWLHGEISQLMSHTIEQSEKAGH